MNGTPSRTCPRLAADALRAVYEPGTTWLRAGAARPAAAVARAMVAALQPPAADDAVPDFLRPDQHHAFRRALAAIRRHRGALLAESVGSGKTWVALAVARVFGAGRPTAVIAPASLRHHWERTATALGVAIRFGSCTRASSGRLPDLHGFAIIDESHHFRTPTTRRYAHVARWLIGHQALLLSATPVVNRLTDLAAQLRLVVRDDALALSGVGSLEALLAGGAGHPALADLVIASPPRGETRRGSRVLSVPDPDLALIHEVDSLELSRERPVAALVRQVFWRALASSPAALAETAATYEALLAHAAGAAAAGKSVSRSVIRQLTGSDELQLVMWELVGEAGDPVLSLKDLPAVRTVIRCARQACQADDGKAALVRGLLQDERPSLIFATRRATVRYLRDRLASRRPAWCTGSAAGVGSLLASRAQVLDWFALGAAAPVPLPTLLITTDVLSEGLDLARLGRVIHYDLPWTAARLEQRDGRSRRGPAAHDVESILLPPSPALAALIDLEGLLEHKRHLPAVVDVGSDASRLWRWRESLAHAMGPGGMAPGCAALRGDLPAVLAVIEVIEHAAAEPHVTGRVVLHLDAQGTLSDEPAPVTDILLRAAREADQPAPSRAEISTALALVAPHARAMLRRHEAAAWWRRTRGSRRLVARLTALARQARHDRNRVALLGLEGALRAAGGGRTAGEDALARELEALDDATLAREVARFPAHAEGTGLLTARLAGLLVIRDGALPFPNGRTTFGRHDPP